VIAGGAGTNALSVTHGTSTASFQVRDSGTTNVPNAFQLSHNSTGTPGTGFGVAVLYGLETTTTEFTNAAYEAIIWVDATHASRKARKQFFVFDTALREYLRGEANGSAPGIGFLGAAAVVRQTLGAAATDAATTQTLANNIRTALINLGLGQT
jgi:hypothetical protein